MGTFKGAKHFNIEAFRQFPDAAKSNPLPKDKKIGEMGGRAGAKRQQSIIPTSYLTSNLPLVASLPPPPQ